MSQVSRSEPRRLPVGTPGPTLEGDRPSEIPSAACGRRGRVARALAALALALPLAAGLCAPALAGPDLEPPPEAPEGSDYEAELVDSLAADQLELSFGAAGRSGGGPRQTRRLRFSGDSLGGTLREGAGDPLSGGGVAGRAGAGSFEVGRLAPRWGRGLVLGSPAEPWSMKAHDRGVNATFRGRSGQGAAFRGGGRLAYQALYGRFGKRSLGGFSTGLGGLSLGTLADRHGGRQTSLSFERGRAGAECAMDRAGRWRAEVGFARRLGHASLTGRLRGGHADFISLAEPKRSGPAQALALGLDGRAAAVRYAALGAMWRFHSGLGGARVMVEGHLRSARGRLTLGVEEQHGVRRISSSSTAGFRQGWWVEWRAGSPALGLGVRHEAWGAHRLARDPVRAVTGARVQTVLGGRVQVKLAHTVFRVRRGESVYLPEVESDRLVLHALTGFGERTRLDLAIPVGGGSVRASLSVTRVEPKPARAQWRLEWMRRGRWKRGR